MQSFIPIAHSYQKLYRGGRNPPPPSQKSSKKPILNRVKCVYCCFFHIFRNVTLVIHSEDIFRCPWRGFPIEAMYVCRFFHANSFPGVLPIQIIPHRLSHMTTFNPRIRLEGLIYFMHALHIGQIASSSDLPSIFGTRQNRQKSCSQGITKIGILTTSSQSEQKQKRRCGSCSTFN